MTERHFADRDVAAILRRAADLDSKSTEGREARGLSAADLEDIAREVGIDPAMVKRAIRELDGHRGRSSSGLLGPPPVNREIRVVPGELDQDTIRRIMRLVDERVPAQGTIGEALGSVRWSSADRFLSRQVSIEPSASETLIRVEERYSDAFRTALHGIVTTYGLFAGLVVGLELLGGPGAGALMAGAAGASAWAIARGAWSAISRRSAQRIKALSDLLQGEADRALGAGNEVLAIDSGEGAT